MIGPRLRSEVLLANEISQFRFQFIPNKAMNRLDFKHTLFCAIFTALSVSTALAATYPVIIDKDADTRINWAAKELSGFLQEIYPEDFFPVIHSVPERGDFILLAIGRDVGFIKESVSEEEVDEPGEFVVRQVVMGAQRVGAVLGNDSRAVFDGVYALLEQ
jgi:alpha-glucuronidase